MWGCQHFQARDNRALFPCHIGKIINIPRVCFQAALQNKSQTVVSPGSLVPQNCLFSLRESPTGGGTSEIPCGARGCSVPDVPCTPGTELLHIHGELSLAPVSVGIHETPGHLCTPWTALVTLSSGPGSSSEGPSPTASPSRRGCPTGQGLSRRRPSGASGRSHPPCLGGKEIQGVLWPLSFHLWEHPPATPIWSGGI